MRRRNRGSRAYSCRIEGHALSRERDARLETCVVGMGAREHRGSHVWLAGRAFTVSASMREDVRHYIERQAEHHRTRTFGEEYLELLQKSGVAFDEKYLD